LGSKTTNLASSLFDMLRSTYRLPRASVYEVHSFHLDAEGEQARLSGVRWVGEEEAGARERVREREAVLSEETNWSVEQNHSPLQKICK
jgi:hypothetical protein